MKVALVHDYLNQSGGAERVLAVFHRMFPEAPIFTTIADKHVVHDLLDGADVRTSWMQWLPGIKKHYRKYFLLYPSAIESFDLSEYDLIISSSSAYAKAVIRRPDACHICYCHTPMRFAWNLESYASRESWGAMTRAAVSLLMGGLRNWDIRTADRPTIFVANSTVVAARIREHYHRPAVVVHPPVEVDRFTPSEVDEDYYLVVSRLVPYKRIDLVIDAFNHLGRPLVIIGDGPARRSLMRRSGDNIRFLGRLPDRTVAKYYARCRALVFPGEEDFGIAPLEAMASGRPVIAYGAGGALDTVVEGQTGVYFQAQTPRSLAAAVEQSDRYSWDKRRIRYHAESFREEVFRTRFMAVVASALGKRRDALRPELIPATI